MAALLEVKRLEKRFGGLKAISELSFSVPERMIFSIIGPNGAGKTTLFNLLTNIYRPSSGSILFKGKDITSLPPFKIARLGISRTFQNLQVFLNMNVIENVMVGCHLRSKSGLIASALRLPSVIKEERDVKQMALESLKFCGLSDYANRPAGGLPYGILKKLEVARAIAAKPKLLLMDEPAAGLNDTETAELCQLIKRICDSGITVLLVEHNMSLIMEISQRVLVLNYGRLLAEGPPEEIQKNPEVIAAYLGQG